MKVINYCIICLTVSAILTISVTVCLLIFGNKDLLSASVVATLIATTCAFAIKICDILIIRNNENEKLINERNMEFFEKMMDNITKEIQKYRCELIEQYQNFDINYLINLENAGKLSEFPNNTENIDLRKKLENIQVLKSKSNEIEKKLRESIHNTEKIQITLNQISNSKIPKQDNNKVRLHIE